MLLFVVTVNAVASVFVVSISVVCDQVAQVVPAHQVDDIDEVHELDPVRTSSRSSRTLGVS